MGEENACFILKQYLGFHDTYRKIYGKKSLVLMMVGQFYEIYGIITDTLAIGPELYELSDLLNIQVSRRNKKIKEISYDNFLMAGFPEHALLKFQNILLSHDYTVIIVNQVTPKPNPERKVVEIVSPGTTIEDYNQSDSNYLVSMFIASYPTVENVPIVSVGLSAIDISTGKNFVHSVQSSVSDPKIWKDEVFRLIHNYGPKEVLIHCEESSDVLEEWCHFWNLKRENVYWNFCESKEFLKPSYQNAYYRKIYTDCGSLTPIEYLGFERCPEITMSHIYMIEFIYQHKIENIREIHCPTIENSQTHLILSHNCMYQLYLIGQKEHASETYDSLLSLLNRCKTAIGRRLCRERLLYPILDTDTLNQRYATIAEFQKGSLYEACMPHLQKITDVEKSFRKMGLGVLNPYEFYSQHQSLLCLLKLGEILGDEFETLESHFTEGFREMLQMTRSFIQSYESLFVLDELEKYSLATMDTSVFQKDVYPELDELDTKFRECQETIEIIADNLGHAIDPKKTDVVKISYTDKFGYELQTTKIRGQTLAKRLAKRTKDALVFKKQGTTVCELSKRDVVISQRGSNAIIRIPLVESLSQKIISVKKQIQTINRENYLENLRKLHKEYKETFKTIVDFIGLIDLNATIAKISVKNIYTRPQIAESDKSFLDARDIRHPLVEKIQTDVPYIPNDVRLSEEGLLLFGTNACGKSTLMKSVGLTVIMAQAGFYVPCSEFTYSPYTQIFTRILNNDNIFRGQSSFAVEMSELRGIVERCDHKSLVLGDELCSGTENVSALSIVSAGLKTLANKRASFVFTSHLHQLMEIPMVREIPNLNVCHLKIRYDSERDLLIYDRKLAQGSGPPIYGLEVCKAMGLDSEFLALAKSVQLQITGESPTFLSDKQSHYNSQITMDVCQVCSQPSTETHHIQEQQTADEHGNIQHFHKNIKHNLVPLCEECHQKVHNENLRIYGYEMTDKGPKLHYEYLGGSEKPPRTRKKKFSDKDIAIILQYKDAILDKRTKVAHCATNLSLAHNIDISTQTLMKIIKGTY